VAQRLREDVARGGCAFTVEHGQPPGLAAVLVGEDPAWAVRFVMPTSSAARVSLGQLTCSEW
jgi:hypothetical protein